MEAATLVADGAASWISVMVEIIDFTTTPHTHTHTHIDCTEKHSLPPKFRSVLISSSLCFEGCFHGSPSGATG